MEFKVGDKVKVIRKSLYDEIYWNPLMDKTIGRVYTVLDIRDHLHGHLGELRLNTQGDANHDFLYPPKSVSKISEKGKQLLFDFMV